LLNGKRAAEYTQRLMFDASPRINSPFIDSTMEEYAQTVYNRPFSSLDGEA
jgi:hypothetical protein